MTEEYGQGAVQYIHKYYILPLPQINRFSLLVHPWNNSPQLWSANRFVALFHYNGLINSFPRVS